MKLIKKISISIIMFIMFVFFIADSVSAGGFNVSAPSAVKPGQTFYVSLSNVAGDFNISVSNGAGGGGTGFIDAMDRPASFAVTAGQSGQVTVVIRANAAGTFVPQKDISGQSKTLVVDIVQPQQSNLQPSTPQQSAPQEMAKPEEVKPEEPVKSSDNTLKEITVSEGKLFPAFSADITEYSVVLPKDVKSIEVNAATNHEAASVTNTGTHDLKIGENLVSLIVTPEDGSSDNLYKVNVYVEDELTEKITINNKDFFIVDHFNGVKLPDTFKETIIDFNGKEIPALESDIWNVTLLYLEDSDKGRNFYIVEKQGGVYEIVSLFRTVSIGGSDYLLLEVPKAEQDRLNMTYDTFMIEKEEFNGFVYDDESLDDFKIIYLQDKEGNKFFYRYDAKDKSWQRYPNHVALSESDYLDQIAQLNTERSIYKYISYGSTGVMIAYLIYIFVKKGKS